MIIGEDDEQIEAWYLLAFVLHRKKKFTTCMECANNVLTLMNKLKVFNQELQSATEEIIKDCTKQLQKFKKAEVFEVKED
jgi:hypothetical protein